MPAALSFHLINAINSHVVGIPEKVSIEMTK